MRKFLFPLLMATSAIAASPYEEQRMQDTCFAAISAVFAKGAKVSGVKIAEGLIHNRAHYIVTFNISGPIPFWYREKTASCYFDKSTRELKGDDTHDPRYLVERKQEERTSDSQEQFKVNRYNSRLHRVY